MSGYLAGPNDSGYRRAGTRDIAFAFFKPTERDGRTINGAPILDDAHASVECRVVEIVARGDHHVVLGEVTGARVARAPAGRPEEAILEMKDLGEKVFYGG